MSSFWKLSLCLTMSAAEPGCNSGRGGKAAHIFHDRHGRCGQSAGGWVVTKRLASLNCRPGGARVLLWTRKFGARAVQVSGCCVGANLLMRDRLCIISSRRLFTGHIPSSLHGRYDLVALFLMGFRGLWRTEEIVGFRPKNLLWIGRSARKVVVILGATKTTTRKNAPEQGVVADPGLAVALRWACVGVGPL